MIKIGLLEDDELIYFDWEMKLSSCEFNCKLEWFCNVDNLMREVSKLDLLVLDRYIDYNEENRDIFMSGDIVKIRNIYSGPIIFSSNSKLSNDYKKYVNHIIQNKNNVNVEKVVSIFFGKGTPQTL